MSRRARALAGLVGALALAPAAAAQPGGPSAPPSRAWLAGERLEFVIRWGIVPAGRAVLEVEPGSRHRVTLRATAKSLPWLDWMYPVRHRMESTVTLPELLPERLLDVTGGRARRESVKEVVFDRLSGTATYRRDGQEARQVEIPENARDALASFYAFRSLEFEGQRVELPVTDGKKVVTGIVVVHGRETVETPAGTFRTFKIEPRIEGVGGVIRKSPGARVFIWLTDDELRRPVRVRTRVALGRVSAVLTRIVESGEGVDSGAFDPTDAEGRGRGASGGPSTGERSVIE